MNDEQRKRIEDSIKISIFDEDDGHLANIDLLRNRLYSQSDMQKYNSYMDASSASKAFFDMEPGELIKRYLEEINCVSEYLGDSSFSEKQKIINYMEYIRMNGMYENLSRSSVENKVVYAGLSQSGLNIAILGKGVCKSQAEFLSHLLIASDMQAYNEQVQFYDKQSGAYIDSHEVTTAELLDGQSYFLDPTMYNGSSDSLKGTFDKANLEEERKEKLTILDVTEDEISEARECVQNYLIERYGIMEISKQLDLDNCSDLEKQMRILTFIEKNLAPTEQELSIRSAVIGSHEIEVGKLMELFYKANDIPYEIQYEEGKQNTIYKTIIDGTECSIYPREAFSKVKPSLSMKLHWAKDEDGVFKRLWEFSEDKKNEIASMIRKGREISESVIVPNENPNVSVWEFIDEKGDTEVSKTSEELQKEENERVQRYQRGPESVMIFDTNIQPNTNIQYTENSIGKATAKVETTKKIESRARINQDIKEQELDEIKEN